MRPSTLQVSFGETNFVGRKGQKELAIKQRAVSKGKSIQRRVEGKCLCAGKLNYFSRMC